MYGHCVSDEDKEEEAKGVFEQKMQQMKKEQEITGDSKQLQPVASLTTSEDIGQPGYQERGTLRNSAFRKDSSQNMYANQAESQNHGQNLGLNQEMTHRIVSSNSEMSLGSGNGDVTIQMVPVYAARNNLPQSTMPQMQMQVPVQMIVPTLPPIPSVSYDMTADDMNDNRSQKYATKIAKQSWDKKASSGAPPSDQKPRSQQRIPKSGDADAYAFELPSNYIHPPAPKKIIMRTA
ncbi:hypothetical protein RFI_27703 [Reticulomyxa filosa]|uniref:Uncharacterized protein n=1 Tax=Reticulomyxa filosa TaxID=46433 RepID=X6M879_RETFI|nr:hypothetical protein RFI_27703 [Reticulomyxa filosa]|eukprot:ETO09672.1 hypothetical protein RFI_27703 [Reticulomyxa filosa]